jgi:adenylate kinase
MIITLTGTPGTGKTSVSEKLAEKGFGVVHLTEYMERKDIGEEIGGEREVRVNELLEELEKEDFEKDTVIEGHLAHHFRADICVVLRCDPNELRERLSQRSYEDRKVEENIEAEKLDIVLSEAVQNQSTIIEVDTTEDSVGKVVDEIIEKVNRGEDDYGNVDWTNLI